MARVFQELCILCEKSPCECNKPKKAASKSAIRSAPRQQPAQDEPRQKVLKIQQAAPTTARRALPAAVRSPQPLPRTAQEQSDDDADMRRALTVICQSGLMCIEDIQRLRNELDMTAVEIDALIWRRKRAKYTQRSQS